MDDAQARATLKAHGFEVPQRGKLSAEMHAQAAQLAAEDRTEPPPGPPGDYDDGVTDADFPAAGDAPPAEPVPERPPRRAARARRPSLSARIRSGAGGQGGRPKRRHPRMPVDRVIEMGWDWAARLATQIDVPVGRVLSMQAPVAGLVLEDVVKGTVVDRVLQPVARAEDKGKKVAALALPPLCVLGLEMAQQLPDRERMTREAFLIPILRESMVLWLDVAGDKVEAKAQRDAERGPIYEQVDGLLAMIFNPPTAPPGTSPPGEPAPEPQTAGV
jgi:hypothetical protein